MNNVPCSKEGAFFFNVWKHKAKSPNHLFRNHLFVSFMFIFFANAFAQRMSPFNTSPYLCVTNNLPVNLCCNSPLISHYSVISIARFCLWRYTGSSLIIPRGAWSVVMLFSLTVTTCKPELGPRCLYVLELHVLTLLYEMIPLSLCAREVMSGN